MAVLLGCFNCRTVEVEDDRDEAQTHPTKTSVHDESCYEKKEELNKVLKRFSWEEIERLTSSFAEVIGVGGFSTVYLARFPDSSYGAVKVYNCSERLTKVFNGELEITSQLCHKNIITILGYCDERDEGVLVFEYIPCGNLQEKIHNNSIVEVLPWESRTTIAFQLAQALEYLHEKHSPSIVHGDIKSSNILLENLKSCKLCDFGFAKTGFSSSVKSRTSTSSRIAMMGSPGYIDPHYIMTGIASKTSDIYSFGVVLLELITGLDAFCPKKEKLLTTIVRNNNNNDFDIEKVVDMVDPMLGLRFDVKEVRAMACISGMCLHHLPSLRPSATEICQAMQESFPSLSFLCMSNKV